MCAAILYLLKKNKNQFNRKEFTTATSLWFAMLLSKQVFLFFPIIVCWYLFATTKEIKFSSLINRFTRKHLIVITIITLASLGIYLVHIEPNLGNAPVSSKVFLYSQLANLPSILSFLYLMPVNTSLLHDMPWQTEFLQNYNALLGSTIFLLLLSIAWKYRHQQIGLLLGCFLISYLPTNSFIPKTEVVIEWRLYPSLVFFSLLIASLVTQTMVEKKYFSLIIPSLFLTLYAVLTFQQNAIYQSPETTYQQVIQQYPRSEIAFNNLGHYYLENKQYGLAEKNFIKAVELKPEYIKPKANLYLLYKALGDKTRADEFFKIITKPPSSK